jgi:hypothetical protein
VRRTQSQRANTSVPAAPRSRQCSGGTRSRMWRCPAFVLAVLLFDGTAAQMTIDIQWEQTPNGLRPRLPALQESEPTNDYAAPANVRTTSLADLTQEQLAAVVKGMGGSCEACTTQGHWVSAVRSACLDVRARPRTHFLATPGLARCSPEARLVFCSCRRRSSSRPSTRAMSNARAAARASTTLIAYSTASTSLWSSERPRSPPPPGISACYALLCAAARCCASQVVAHRCVTKPAAQNYTDASE